MVKDPPKKRPIEDTYSKDAAAANIEKKQRVTRASSRIAKMANAAAPTRNRSASAPPRVSPRQKSSWQVTLQSADLAKMSVTSTASIKALLKTINELNPYTLDGAEHAETKVLQSPKGKKTVSYKTKDNEHSEMLAIRLQIANKKWMLTSAGKVVWRNPNGSEGGPIAPEAFTTDVPHCAACTIMLKTLSLPFTVAPHPSRTINNRAADVKFDKSIHKVAKSFASKGQHQMMSALNYPVEGELRSSLAVIAHLLAKTGSIDTGYQAIKKIADMCRAMGSPNWVLVVPITEKSVKYFNAQGPKKPSEIANLERVHWNDLSAVLFNLKLVGVPWAGNDGRKTFLQVLWLVILAGIKENSVAAEKL